MPLISTRDAASRAGFTQSHIRGLIAAGSLKAQRIGNSWAVDSVSLDRYLKADRRPGPRTRASYLRQRN
jgi:excisionase family DNA binding protein